ncbi:alcohol dehydrogenase catalytic domain-containing protein [Escherichia coli]
MNNTGGFKNEKNSKSNIAGAGHNEKLFQQKYQCLKKMKFLIKVEYVGICGSDVHGFKSGPFIPPKDPNQEIGWVMNAPGTVVAVGSSVCKFKQGDRVNIELAFLAVTVVTVWKANITSARTLIFMATQPNYRGALTHYLCHPESFTLQTARQYGHDGRGAGGACRSRDACRDAGRCLTG